jgi:hypothetical protein
MKVCRENAPTALPSLRICLMNCSIGRKYGLVNLSPAALRCGSCLRSREQGNIRVIISWRPSAQAGGLQDERILGKVLWRTIEVLPESIASSRSAALDRPLGLPIAMSFRLSRVFLQLGKHLVPGESVAPVIDCSHRTEGVNSFLTMQQRSRLVGVGAVHLSAHRTLPSRNPSRQQSQEKPT